MEIVENSIKTLIDAIAEDVCAQADKRYGSTAEYVAGILGNSAYDFGNPDVFHTLFMFPMDEALQRVVGRLVPQKAQDGSSLEKTAFVYMHYAYLSANIESLIQKRLSSTCIADQSRHLIQKYLSYVLTGNYPEGKLGDGYWMVKFGTYAEWFCFIDGLYMLYYGRNEKYEDAYGRLMEAEIRKFPHKKHTLIGTLGDGMEIALAYGFDDKLPEPPVPDNGYYRIPCILFGGAEVPYKNVDVLYYMVPENEISVSRVRTETVYT